VIKNVIIDVEAAWQSLPFDMDKSSPVACWYFGDNYSEYRGLKIKYADELIFSPVGEALNDAAQNLKNDVVNIDTFFPQSGFGREIFEASALGEGNPYTSDLFVNICRSKVFADAVKAGGGNLFIVEDGAFGQVLKKMATSFGGAVDIQISKVRQRPSLLAAVVRQLKNIYRLHENIQVQKRFRKKNPLNIEDLRKANFFVSIWARPDSFENQAQQSDAYWGMLAERLNKAGVKLAYIASPVNWIFAQKDIHESASHAQDPVLFINDCVRWIDLLKGAVGAVVFPFTAPKFASIGDIEISYVLRLEAQKESQKGNIIKNIAYKSVGRKLKALGCEPDAVLHLYEGQGWEKLLRKGIRQNISKTKVIGCQHTPFAPLYLGFFHSQKDLNNGCRPDLLTAIGRHDRNGFIKNGLRDEDVFELGALRYETVLNAENGEGLHQGGGILCCTSISYAESLELACKAVEATAATENAQLVINFHPVTDVGFRAKLQNEVCEFVSCEFSHVTFSDLPSGELMSATKVVLYNSSAAAFDAMAIGISVIYVGCDTTLDYNKVPKEMCCEARTIEELVTILCVTDDYPEIAAETLQAKTRQDVRKCLGEPDVEGLRVAIKSTTTLRELGVS